MQPILEDLDEPPKKPLVPEDLLSVTLNADFSPEVLTVFCKSQSSKTLRELPLTKHSGPGNYRIVHAFGVYVRSEISLDSSLVAILDCGTIVTAVEVREVHSRARARLLRPAGWISLSHLEHGTTWAEKVFVHACGREVGVSCKVGLQKHVPWSSWKWQELLLGSWGVVRVCDNCPSDDDEEDLGDEMKRYALWV